MLLREQSCYIRSETWFVQKCSEIPTLGPAMLEFTLSEIGMGRKDAWLCLEVSLKARLRLDAARCDTRPSKANP